ncbi:hypothetical protein M0804_004649 [Polistes exclamans]|nr:hypothetical protein M0804_004649 [Polistes exclamans]
MVVEEEEEEEKDEALSKSATSWVQRKLVSGGGDGDQPHNDRVPRAKAPLTNRPTGPFGSGLGDDTVLFYHFEGRRHHQKSSPNPYNQ